MRWLLLSLIVLGGHFLSAQQQAPVNPDTLFRSGTLGNKRSTNKGAAGQRGFGGGGL